MRHVELTATAGSDLRFMALITLGPLSLFNSLLAVTTVVKKKSCKSSAHSMGNYFVSLVRPRNIDGTPTEPWDARKRVASVTSTSISLLSSHAARPFVYCKTILPTYPSAIFTSDIVMTPILRGKILFSCLENEQERFYRNIANAMALL
jgi:hypothetical protein